MTAEEDIAKVERLVPLCRGAQIFRHVRNIREALYLILKTTYNNVFVIDGASSDDRA